MRKYFNIMQPNPHEVQILYVIKLILILKEIITAVKV